MDWSRATRSINSSVGRGGGLVDLEGKSSKVFKYGRGEVGGVAKMSSQGSIVVVKGGGVVIGGMTKGVVIYGTSGVCDGGSIGVEGGVRFLVDEEALEALVMLMAFYGLRFLGINFSVTPDQPDPFEMDPPFAAEGIRLSDAETQNNTPKT
ncbi:hypothetical protein Tco_0273168 [Tanacetum coccineum]